MRKILAVCFLLGFTESEMTLPPMRGVTMLQRSGISWHSWIECIAWQESRHWQWAKSKLGVYHGRGRYQISVPCLNHYIWEHPGTEWITPDSLYNVEISRQIAIWYLEKCSRVYDEINPPHGRFEWVLSAYNQGIDGTISNGINHSYVKGVWEARRFLK